MQLGAINSVNFNGDYKPYNNTAYIKNENEKRLEARINNAVRKAQQNVHIGTIVSGAAILGTAAIKGKNIAPMIRQGAIKTGEIIAKAGVRVAGTITGAGTSIINKAKAIKNPKIGPIKHVKNPIDIAKINGNGEGSIHSKLKKFYDINKKEVTLENSDMLKSLNKNLADVVGKERAKKVVNGLDKLGIRTMTNVADTLGAIGVGMLITDPIADKVEKELDEEDIVNAAKTFINQV